jgi:hypothetical protein
MKDELDSLSALSNQQLLEQVLTLATREREATARLIAALVEMELRRLYLAQGFSSLFTYCTEALRFSEDAAYNRMKAARVASKWPLVLSRIVDGSLTVTAVRLLAGSLTDENHQQLLESARHRTKREVEQIVAALHPQPAVPSTIRKLPPGKPASAPSVAVSVPEPPCPKLSSGTTAPVPAHSSLPSPRSAVIAPLAPERYKVQITVSRDTHDKLRRVQDLLRHQLPDGDPAAIFDRALTVLLQDLERRKLTQTARPRPPHQSKAGSRHVPAAVRRAVWRRDEGRCAFVGQAGRCSERGFLELPHVVPFAHGGPTTSANLQLRCRAHNLYEAEERFGPLFVREERVADKLVPERDGVPRQNHVFVIPRDLTIALFLPSREVTGMLICLAAMDVKNCWKTLGMGPRTT